MPFPSPSLRPSCASCSMSAPDPRLKGAHGAYGGPWPVGTVPDNVLYTLGREIVHWRAVGNETIGGNKFADMFAEAVGGEHLASAIGLGDVVRDDGIAWSCKTVKVRNVRKAKMVRLISGRNSPDFSLGISDPRKDPEATGHAVLAVWNKRLNESLDQFNKLRLVCLLRGHGLRDFCLFEQPVAPFPTEDFYWRFEALMKGANENLQGYEKATRTHRFTWQPHGGQFTVKRPVPGSARYFRIVKNIPQHTKEGVLKWIGYRDQWIEVG